MDVFSFRDELIRDYESFSRSFSRIWVEDIKSVLNEVYKNGDSCPSP